MRQRGKKTYTRPTTPEETEAAIERSKRHIESRRTKPEEQPRGRKTKHIAEVSARINDAKIPFTLSWIHVSELSLDTTHGIKNQIMLMYSNGIFEILPQHVNGKNIIEYVGLRFNRITYWCMLPTISSPNHFHTFHAYLTKQFNKARDVFDL